MALGGIALALFTLALYFTGGVGASSPTGPGSYSRSAIGHMGLYELLAAAGKRVERADADPLGRLGADDVLVLVEPEVPALDHSLRMKMSTAPHVLLILPKTGGRPDPAHPGWLRETFLLPENAPLAALRELSDKAALVRDPGPLTAQRFLYSPTIAGAPQAARVPGYSVVIGASDAFVVGERYLFPRRIVVLADPEPLQNQGLTKADNAAFALELFGVAGAGANARFVFDETIHGASSQSATGSDLSPLRRLLAFPGDLLAGLAAVAIALLIGSTIGRFGPPLEAVPVREPGKRALVDNVASLIDYGGHHASALRRYIEVELREAASSLRPAPGVREAADWAALDKLSEKRGVAGRPSRLIAEASAAGNDPKTLFAIAVAANRWKEEMTNGSR